MSSVIAARSAGEGFYLKADIAFNFYDPAGNQIDCYPMQEEANFWNISLRSGCFCNSGVREVALNFAGEEMVACLQDRESSLKPNHCIRVHSPYMSGIWDQRIPTWQAVSTIWHCCIIVRESSLKPNHCTSVPFQSMSVYWDQSTLIHSIYGKGTPHF